MGRPVTGARRPYRPDTNGEEGSAAPRPDRPDTNREQRSAAPRPRPSGTGGERGTGEPHRRRPYTDSEREGGGTPRPLWRDPVPGPSGRGGSGAQRGATSRSLWRDPAPRPSRHGTRRELTDSGILRLRLGRASSSKRQLSTLARGGALNLFGLLVSGPMQIALTIVVARSVGTAGTGAFFLAVALFTILSNIGELGADTGLVKMLPQYRALGRSRDLTRVVRTALWPPVVFCTGLAVLTWLLAPQLASVLARAERAAEVESYLRTFALFIPLGAVSTVVLAGTRGMGTMVPFVSVQNILVPALRPILVGAALTLGLGTVAIALGWAAPLGIAFALGIVLLWVLIRRARDREPSSRRTADRRGISSEFWRFAGPRALAVVFGITVTWLDVLLVGAFMHSTRQAGIYAAASRLSVVGATALSAVGMAIAPQVSQLATLGKIRDAESVFQVGTWWLMALTWPAYISLAVFAPFLLNVFGHGFAAGHAALTILCLAQLFNLGTGNVTIVLLMVGKSSWNLINSAASLVVNIGLNILLIPRLGITGAAIAWAASIVVSNMSALLEVTYLMRIRPFGTGYWVVAVSSVICFGMTGLIVRAVVGANWTGFALFVALSTIPYAAVLWRVRGILRLSAFRGAISRRRPAPASR